MIRALIVAAVVAAFGFGIAWGIDMGRSSPRPPPYCRLGEYRMASSIHTTAMSLARHGDTEICVRATGVLVCEPLEMTP
jgi:hypothetical protein